MGVTNIIMENILFNFLQDWYFKQCDGDWEHQYGIKINTLDNPGWSVVIDLIDTNCEKKGFSEIDKQINDNNWIQCNVKNGKFIGAGGPNNLIDIINIFITWKNS